MKRTANLFWGISLILLSAGLLADRLGYIDFNEISDNVWVLVFSGAALLFFLSYILNGFKKWGWLFPAFTCTALSLTLWLVARKAEGAFLGAPILAAVALPFFIGFGFNRRNWGLLIPAWILTVLTFITLLVDRVDGNLIGVLFLFSVAFPFLVAFLINRQRWWALITAWCLFILGMVTLVSNLINGSLVATLFMYSVALPFLVVYLVNRSRRWALVPAAVIAILGTFPLLSMVISGELASTLGVFLFALPFFIVYFRWNEAWWALIPAGIFACAGLVLVLSKVFPAPLDRWNYILNGIFLLGLGTTFGLLWLRRASQPTDWAKYPAVALLAASMLAFILGRNFQTYWAVVLMVVGLMMIITSLLPRKPKNPTPPAEIS